MPAISQFRQLPWLFSPAVDLAAFGGSAAISLLLLALGSLGGWLNAETPEWTWITAVLLVDVAHVYATAFRVYFNPAELKRRAWLYALTPLLAWLFGVAIYSENPVIFWRCLAYVAVFHFVRQQYGWVALYRAKAGEQGGWGQWIDAGAIYAATLYPLLYWHAHLPRQFGWFALPGEFVPLPALVAQWAWPGYVLALVAYTLRAVLRGIRHGRWNPGKDVVVATTAACWYLGMVTFNSDYAFTVTNVIIHGVPYMVLVQWQRRPSLGPAARLHLQWLPYLASLWLMAYTEELLWDRGLWQQRPWLFGSGGELPAAARMWLVPLLAVPQLTHYVLDGFVWRRRRNPAVAQWVEPGGARGALE